MGEALLSRGAIEPEREAEVGWHLLRGGDRPAGARLLERAGRRLFRAQSFFDAIPPLEAALEVYDERRRAPRVLLELRHMLLMSGCLADRATAARHKDAAVVGFGRFSGVSLARRLRPWLGRHLALVVGLSWAGLRWVFALPRRRGPSPMEALRTFFIVAGYATSVHTMSYDVEGARALVRKIAPIPVFERRIPYAVYLMIHTLVATIEGRQGTARRNARRTRPASS